MSYSWRAFSLFGAGVLFGLVASAVLFAPPEMANQPPPWEHWARKQAPGAAANTAVVPTPEVQPVAAAANPPAAMQPPAPAEPPVVAAEASSAPPAAPVVTASTTPAVKKRKVPKEEPAADTGTLGAGPAAYPVSVAPEGLRPQPDEALPRTVSDTSDPSR